MRYSIGIDLGTNANGIAVITDDLKLVRYKNKNVWSVLKFDKGETAQKRRGFRTSRRRLKRRKIRIVNLRMLLEKDIVNMDSTFLLRLEESFMYKEDRKNNDSKYNLFIDKDFNDRDFYRENKTIYHLREKLINEKDKKDLRLIYLALHHIIKYRGHFIFEGEEFSKDSLNNEMLVKELINSCIEHFDINIKELNQLEILESNDKSRKDKVNELLAIEKYSVEEKNVLKQIYNGIVGLTVETQKIFKDFEVGDIKSLKMDEDELDEKIDGLSNIVDEKIEVINIIKSLYSGIKLKEILGDETFISSAMVKKYDKFHKELKLLKLLIKEYCPDKEYNALFKGDDKTPALYEDYIQNKIKSKDKKNTFYTKIESLIKDINTEDSNKILKEIEKESFLIKLNTKANSTIPYQIHLQELREILKNQGQYYDVLKENEQKIIQIFTFKIPYYVGPLGKSKKFGWMEKKEGYEGEKIYPWNFEKVVDVEKSAEEFITKMTSYCSYVPSEKVLPFNSILYTEYLYYNEVNKIRFNGNLLDRVEKDALKEEVFMKKDNVTENDLKKWYQKNHFYLNLSKIEVTGFMGEEKVNVTLKPIRDFVGIYGQINQSNIEDIEKIIYYISVFEDKKILKLKLDNEFKLSEENKSKILTFKYKGWGKISKYVLNTLSVKEGKYVGKTILDILKETNLNFMQIINDSSLGFSKIIEEKNGSDKIDKIRYEDHIKPLQGSPALKKGIYQGVKQIEEIIKFMGCPPESIFVEFAKSDEDSKRTLARNKKLLSIFNEIDVLDNKDKEIIKKLKDSKFKIDNERIYLYCMQRGKCLYSNTPLEIDQLYNYEVDHIIPRSLIKDDSLSNKALVLKEYNQRKSNGAIADEIINNMRGTWSNLLEYKLIPKKKFDNLTNYSGEFPKEVEQGFLNRQLVEVRQITKHVVNLLNRAYGHKGTKVYSIKAELVDNFKKQFDINKDRNINDLHHAKDAYAVAVVGSYIKTRFPNLDKEFIYDEYKEYTKEYKGKGKFGFIVSSMTTDFINKYDGEIIWYADREISKFKKILSYNDAFVVRKTEIKDGALFKVTRVKKPSGGKLNSYKVPLKNNKEQSLPPEKYGYYEGIEEAYYSIIEFNNKGKQLKRLVGVPIMFKDTIKGNKDKTKEYFESIGYENVNVIKAVIPKYQKIRYKGDEYYITSSNDWCNAKQLKLSQKIYDTICILNDNRKINEISEEKKIELFILVYDILIEKIKENYKVYQSVVEKLKNKRNKFITLTTNEKLKIINEILKLTKANSECANVELLKENQNDKGFDRQGRIEKRSNKDVNDMVFIYESHTGVIKKEVNY